MSLEDFQASPWQKSHETYKKSALSISPAPEYANGDVLISSLCRTIGFKGITEGSVPQAGTNLDNKIKKYADKKKNPEDSSVDAETWQGVLHATLESPRANQSTKRRLQLSPLVPGFTRFSGSARISNNSWHAGALLKKMIWMGAQDKLSAADLWKELFDALTVTPNDDVFARWLSQENESWADEDQLPWIFEEGSETDTIGLPIPDTAHISFPAKQFVKDVRAIIRAKPSMTRRQWISMLDAIVRMATAAHIIWLCDVQARIWSCIDGVIERPELMDEAEIRKRIFPTELRYISYGDKALLSIKDRVSGYLLARMGINATLWTLAKCGVPFEGELSSSDDVYRLCEHLIQHHELTSKQGIRQTILNVNEQEARILLCKKGIGSNLMEFMTHVLGRRQTAVELLRGYDQGYILNKKTKRSQWIASLGPVSAIAVVHCALSGMGGPRSIHVLSQHLSSYGIAIEKHDIANNDLGIQLRMLGLVLDSPDAESGMLLLPPFPASKTTTR
jgi:hypothetical protein